MADEWGSGPDIPFDPGTPSETPHFGPTWNPYNDPTPSGGWYGTQDPNAGGSWQTNYDYTPRYEPGAVSNPTAEQMAYDMKGSGPAMGERFLQQAGGDPEAAHSGP